ncbi:MAG: hypothetical protein EZS28_036453 [Streblomastix strix]|uniref:Uncharacterized protein n=1 Tax=Streblomastix strix TaxID=222440 RepID=A0A5J4UCT8_9EUKA|nr:MAG: hypothetical protein EZS28_036453 [Streblomastix strix]
MPTNALVGLSYLAECRVGQFEEDGKPNQLREGMETDKTKFGSNIIPIPAEFGSDIIPIPAEFAITH